MGYSWDIRDPDVGISRTKTLCKWPFSVVLDREWPGCPRIWVGTSRIWKNFMQENFGLIFCTLVMTIGKMVVAGMFTLGFVQHAC